MKQYSYLHIPYGLESNYRAVQVITPISTAWTLYQCMRVDCLDAERWVAIRQYTRDLIQAQTQEELINKIWNYRGK